MARGFGGETTEQEARGSGLDAAGTPDVGNISASSVASGRADAATSAALGGRDVDPGGGGGDNDYTPRPAVDMSPGRMQAMYGNNPLAIQLAGINQQKFNQARGITSLNPYGKDGFFSRFLGIDPKNVDYSNIMDLRTRGSIANNQYSKFMNPQNLPTLPGYNRDFPTAEKGQLRSGVQKAGYETAFGPVMEQAREQSIGEMAARGAFGLLGGLPGLALGQIGTKEYGLPGRPGFEDFDPNNPRPGGGILGQIFGGVNPTQAAQKAAELKQSIIDEFTTPNLPGPVATSSGASPDLAGFEQRFGNTHPLSGETTVKPSGSSIVDGKTGFQTETLPDGSVRSVQTTGGMTKAEADEIENYFEDTKNLSADEAAARAMERLENPPQFPAAGNYGSRLSGEQLAGGFGIDTIGEAFGRGSVELSPSVQDFLDEHGMSIKDLMDKDFSSVPDGARLPSGQIMGPEFRPNQTSPAPAVDIEQLIRDAVSSRELGGPLTANQLAGSLEYVLPGKGYKGSRTYVPGGNSTPVFGNERFSGEGIMNTIKDLMVPDFIEDYFNQRGMRQRRTG